MLLKNLHTLLSINSIVCHISQITGNYVITGVIYQSTFSCFCVFLPMRLSRDVQSSLFKRISWHMLHQNLLSLFLPRLIVVWSLGKTHRRSWFVWRLSKKYPATSLTLHRTEELREYTRIIVVSITQFFVVKVDAFVDVVWWDALHRTEELRECTRIIVVSITQIFVVKVDAFVDVVWWDAHDQGFLHTFPHLIFLDWFHRKN